MADNHNRLDLGNTLTAVDCDLSTSSSRSELRSSWATSRACPASSRSRPHRRREPAAGHDARDPAPRVPAPLRRDLRLHPRPETSSSTPSSSSPRRTCGRCRWGPSPAIRATYSTGQAHGRRPPRLGAGSADLSSLVDTTLGPHRRLRQELTRERRPPPRRSAPPSLARGPTGPSRVGRAARLQEGAAAWACASPGRARVPERPAQERGAVVFGGVALDPVHGLVVEPKYCPPVNHQHRAPGRPIPPRPRSPPRWGPGRCGSFPAAGCHSRSRGA